MSGKHCCVPNCRGNYDAKEKVSVFLIPKDEKRRSLWMSKIPRDNFVPSATTVVCERHFVDNFIVRIDSATRKDGSVLTVPRSKPKLTADAYPSIFPNCPSYLSETRPLKRKNPEDRRHEMEERDNSSFTEWLESDKINDFSHFNEDFKTRVDSKWLYRFHNGNDNIADHDQQSVHVMDNYWSFYRILDDLESAPRLTATVKVFTDMHVEIFTSKGGRVPKASLSCIFGKPQSSILKTWSQFDTILSQFSSGHSGMESVDLDKKLQLLIDTVEEICSSECADEENDAKRDRLLFLVQQIKLSVSSSKKYSCYTLIWAFKINALSPRAYTIMRSSYLTLPHPSYLRKLASVFQIRSGLTEENVHKEYLKQKCSNLDPRERSIILMLDEIHISPRVSYKEGKLEGSAVNCPIAEASTAQVFMISSVLSKSKDVVAIIPVKNINAAWLKEAILKVLDLLHTTGYSVLCIISDNNRVNRNAFTIIAGGTLQTSITHPNDPTQRLFFLFDSVHLFKCIRNNWLMQKDAEKTFMFPSPSLDTMNNTSLMRSSFAHLIKLYNHEKCSTVKLAPCLNYNSLHPTSLEKQNVKLMLNVFDVRNITALEHFERKWNIDTQGTREFISFINRLWNIFNVKHPYKGVRQRNDNSKPISAPEDQNLCVLQHAFKWLEEWKGRGLKPREGILSNETMTALSHTLSAAIELCIYLLQERGYKYVLLGKFQTDDLELRFSLYRRLSGCNFHVSVQQLLEGEKKLKILSVLHMISASKGSLKLKDFTLPLEETKTQMELISCDTQFDFFNPLLCDCDNIDINDEQQKVLVFIAGYCIVKLLRETVCDTCKHELSIDRQLQVDVSSECYSYISALDRGGLKWPSDFVLTIVTETFKVFQFLIGSSSHEEKFLSCFNQRLLVTRLVKQRLRELNLLDRKCQDCEKDYTDSISKICKPAVNIFLNNYSKSLTDKNVSSKNERKLKTFTKRV